MSEPRDATEPQGVGERHAESPPEDADVHLGESIVLLLVRPRATLEKLVRQKTPRPGASAIALLGTVWSMFLVLLWNAGEQPSFVLLPISPGWYYLIEALCMLPVLTGLWWLHSEITHRIAIRVGGHGHEAGIRAALGFAYATPTLLMVLAELVLYLGWGFETLTFAARISLPLTALAVGVYSTAAVRVGHGVSVPKAALASFAGLLVNGLAAGLFVR